MILLKQLKKMNLINNKYLLKLKLLYRNFNDNHSYVRGKGNDIISKGAKVNSRIQVQGNNNQVILEDESALRNTQIKILGNNNQVVLKKGAYVSGAELWVEDNNCILEIGSFTFVGHHSHLACTENGSRLLVGDRGMISSFVQIRTGDSHSILDSSGNRINNAESVFIGTHCWIGEGARILKGVTLEDNTIVSTGAIVTQSFKGNVLLGGVPAKIIKENVTWDSKRI